MRKSRIAQDGSTIYFVLRAPAISAAKKRLRVRGKRRATSQASDWPLALGRLKVKVVKEHWKESGRVRGWFGWRGVQCVESRIVRVLWLLPAWEMAIWRGMAAFYSQALLLLLSILILFSTF